MHRMYSMKKAAFSLLLPFLAASAFLLLQAAPAAALTVESLQEYIEAARKLDLSDANLLLMNKNKEMTQDAHFMALLRAKLRLARLVKTAKYASGEAKRDSYLLRTQAGPLIGEGSPPRSNLSRTPWSRSSSRSSFRCWSRNCPATTRPS